MTTDRLWLRPRRKRTSCRSTGGTTSSSGSGTRSRPRTSTSARSASRRTAYAGPETGVRDRASYVLEQGSVRFVVTSALREESDITKHSAGTATASRTSRSPCPTRPRRTGRPCSAARADGRAAARRGRVRHDRDCRRSRRTATRSTRSSTAATTRGRSSPATSPSPGEPAATPASVSRRSTTSSATSSSAA